MDRFFPSTRMCSDCGRINDKMALNVRAWDCPCGAAHDRDVNAARNIVADTADPKFAPPELSVRMASAGDAGRKTGKGWYDHS